MLSRTILDKDDEMLNEKVSINYATDHPIPVGDKRIGFFHGTAITNSIPVSKWIVVDENRSYAA